MATKRGRMVSYLEWFSLIKLVTRPFSDVVLQRSHGKPKPLYLRYHISYGYQTSQDGNYLNGLLPIKSRDSLIFRSISLCPEPLSTNMARWWRSMRDLHPWNNKITIVMVTQCLWSPNLWGWWHTTKNSHP